MCGKSNSQWQAIWMAFIPFGSHWHFTVPFALGPFGLQRAFGFGQATDRSESDSEPRSSGEESAKRAWTFQLWVFVFPQKAKALGSNFEQKEGKVICEIDCRVLGGMQFGELAQALFSARLTAVCWGEQFGVLRSCLRCW